jgi:hypothetical protein
VRTRRCSQALKRSRAMHTTRSMPCRYLRQTIEQSSPAQLTALMKFLQVEESSGKASSVAGGTSKPQSPMADDKAEEVRDFCFNLRLVSGAAGSIPSFLGRRAAIQAHRRRC